MASKKILFAAALALCSATSAIAQSDFGVWTEIGVEKSFNKKFSLEASVENRMANNATQPQRWNAAIGGSYKPLKWLKLGAGYVFIYNRNFQEAEEKYKENDEGEIVLGKDGKPIIEGYNVDHGYWRPRHRAYFDVQGKVDVGRFSISLRERYLYNYYVETEALRDKYRNPSQPGYSGNLYPFNGMEFMKYEQEMDTKKAKSKHSLRTRLQVEYDIKGVPLTPFVSCELTNELSNAMQYDKVRAQAGVEWKINKKHILSGAYLYQNENQEIGPNESLHAIKLGYKFKF
ncbi:MAG: DUF2490 domain-containing protein [Bacteroidaceae bacterium]|jgi:hypothetical protein|nr:DUF2490 domain-containing protein [Bacteroidaceae bacterium]